jgi:peptide/nickel transport system ATP-binding protein
MTASTLEMGRPAVAGKAGTRRAEDVGGPAQPLVIVKDLKKHFAAKRKLLARTPPPPVRAVDGVSFSIAKGTTLGVVGESGCGKSTMARLLIRLIEPDAGEVIFDGELVGGPRGIGLRELRSQVQMVFQDSYASLNPRLPIEETVAFGPIGDGVPVAEARRRAVTILDQVGLDSRTFLQRYPHELSGGQRQRVNIARALAIEPRLLILDEAVSALDKSVEAQVLNLLVDLKSQYGLTYLFISHDLNVVRYISDEVMVMYLGEVVEIGPVEKVYAAPRHPYTQALLRSQPSMDPDNRTKSPPITGDPPNPIAPPSGCRFHPRCAHARSICARLAPVLTQDEGSGHLVACHMASATGDALAAWQAEQPLETAR